MNQKEVNEIMTRYVEVEKAHGRVSKLNPNTKRAWVAKLRSGDYKQGTGMLCEWGEDGKRTHCCLGVLGDQMRILKTVTYDNENGWFDNRGGFLTTGAGDEAMLEDETAGLSDFVMQGLAEVNDHGGTFKQIAKWIEANL